MTKTASLTGKGMIYLEQSLTLSVHDILKTHNMFTGKNFN